ncbi:hypothetical protein I2I11_01745 [Pontibacter sp. 172403-2]|uniref:hypothetical protein n=1 Tax=Pontibacter rufus TaxID=2791028 RepID=UPI0018AFF4B8|nr:hypothetical protein [Pontibacter sp. 172403-2]MBF9252007.1 hypothetical protein [Pontibacter sp. 172403-2]
MIENLTTNYCARNATSGDKDWRQKSGNSGLGQALLILKRLADGAILTCCFYSAADVLFLYLSLIYRLAAI